MDRLTYFILYPTAILCRWLPHDYERVPEVVMRGIDPAFVYRPTCLCRRCGKFTVAMERAGTGAES